MDIPPRVALLAAILAAACGRAPEAPTSAGGSANLEAPTPSSVTLAGLLNLASTGYDNIQQARYIQEQAKSLGIANLDKPSGQTGESDDSEQEGITYEEGLQRTKVMTKQFSAQRRAIEKKLPKPVGLEGMTPGMLPPIPGGKPIEGDQP